MNQFTNRRSVMTLYTNNQCLYSHRVRIALAEKSLTVELIEVDLDNKPEELLSINPYGTVPTLVDRDLILYESAIILEYLEERFPHPPLMPVYPVARAKSRLMMHRIDRDWYSLILEGLLGNNRSTVAKARQNLLDSLVSVAPVFADSPYFLSDEFTLVDCSLAALLWRLPLVKIDLPEEPCRPIIKYMQRVFERASFQSSLSDAERELGVVVE